MIVRKTSCFVVAACTTMCVAAPDARAQGDPLPALEERAHEAFVKALPWVVGIRVRVHLPYAAQVSPDGRVIRYARTGPFHLPDASGPFTFIRGETGEWMPLPVPSGSPAQSRNWADRYGTGILFDDRGHILTTYQLVKDSTPGSQMVAISATGQETPAELVAADPYSNVAILASEGLDGRPADFIVTEAPESRPLTEGSLVFAVARPYGLPNSVYFGMVSGLDRKVGQFRYERYIQTTIPLPPGSNGAPLLTLDGKVAGMMSCTLKQEGWTEVSFAVPAAMVQEIGRELIERGTVARGFLGLQVVNPAESAQAQGLGPAAGREPGALVVEVLPESPAMKAGIHPEDVIVGLGDQPINGWEDLVWALHGLKPGDTVSVRILRGDRKLTIPVTVGTLTPEMHRLDRRP